MCSLGFENEYSIAIPPAKLFKAFVLDSDNLISKAVPNAIASSQILEGDGGAGTIRKLNFNQAMGINYVTQKVEAVDKDNLSYTYSLIGGDALPDSLEKITCENQFVASPDGGSICKRITKYYTKVGDVDVNEENVKDVKKTTGLFKAVEAYLLSNPDYA